MSRSFSCLCFLILLPLLGFVFFEPGITMGQATDNVTVSLDVTSGISISDGANINLTAMSVAQQTTVGTTNWTVTTNSAGGYDLRIQASGAPAMTRAGGNIPDYTEGTPGTPEVWNVPSGAYEFGFSARGGNVNTGTWGNDSTTDCVAGANVPSAELRWRGFTGTTPILIATTAAPTTPTGTNTALCVAAEQDTVFVPSGTYTATLTATATAK